MTTTIEQLREKVNITSSKHAAISNARSERERELNNQTRRALDVEFGEALKVTAETVRLAQVELRDAEDAAALANVNLPYPVGTKMAHWKSLERWQHTDVKTHALSGKQGVIEVITRDSVHPDNWDHWKRAKVGTVVVRLLRKNGSEGKEYDTQTMNWLSDKVEFRGWRPVGVDYNAEIHAEALAKIAAEEAKKRKEEQKVLDAAVDVFGLNV